MPHWNVLPVEVKNGRTDANWGNSDLHDRVGSHEMKVSISFLEKIENK